MRRKFLWLAAFFVAATVAYSANAGCFDDFGCQGRDPGTVPGEPTPPAPDLPVDPPVGDQDGEVISDQDEDRHPGSHDGSS